MALWPAPRPAQMIQAKSTRRVGVWRGGLGRSLFSPVGPPFRTRVSHHLDHAPSPHPAHRTRRAVFPHRALGQELMRSPTGSRATVRSGGPVPAPRAGTGRGTVTSPGSSPGAWRTTTGEAGGDCADRGHGTPGSRGRGRSSSTTPGASGSVGPLGPRPPSRASVGRSTRGSRPGGARPSSPTGTSRCRSAPSAASDTARSFSPGN